MLARLRELFNRLGHKKTMPLTFAAALEEWEQTLRAERAAQERLEQAKSLCDGLPIDFSKIVNTAVSEEDLVRLKRLLASNSPAGGGGVHPTIAKPKVVARAPRTMVVSDPSRVWSLLSKADLLVATQAAALPKGKKEQMRAALVEQGRPSVVLKMLEKRTLKEVCTKMKLSVSGNKDALVFRILGGQEDAKETDDEGAGQDEDAIFEL